MGIGQNWPKAPATPARQKQEKSFQQHGNRNSAAARSGNSNLCLWARDINRKRARGVCARVISCSFPAFGGWWWGGGWERGAIDLTGHDRRSSASSSISAITSPSMYLVCVLERALVREEWWWDVAYGCCGGREGAESLENDRSPLRDRSRPILNRPACQTEGQS